MARFRLLSIDGGGIRGLIPALVIAEIERETQRPAAELFDAIAGTSTGGIIALGLSKRIPAEKIAALYKRDGAQIFHEGWIRRTVYGVLDHAKGILPKGLPRLPHHAVPADLVEPKYRAEYRREVLSRVFESTPISAAATRLFIPSYETSRRMPVFFVRGEDVSSSSYHCATSAGTMLDVALATSAAPAYFRPHAVERSLLPLPVDGEGLLSFVDGGIFANNPSGLAHSFLNKGATSDDDMVVSLGTGSMTQPYTFDAIDGWGALEWSLPMLKMMFDGQSEAVAMALQQRLPQGSYYRLQAYLAPTNDADTDHLGVSVSDDLDNSTDTNVAAMEEFAARLIASRRAEIDQLCERLVR